MKQFGNLPYIETLTDELEYAKCFQECAKSAAVFAEKFLGLEVFDYNRAFLDCNERFIVARTGRQCIEENEFIYCNDKLISINNIKNGDNILGGQVSNVHKFQDDLIQINFWNGIKIKVNGKHPFYTTHGWKEAQNLTLNDMIEFKPSNNFSLSEFSVGLRRAKLFGYLYSDGYYRVEQSIKFTNNNLQYLDEVESIISEYYPELRIIRANKNKGFDTRFVANGGTGNNTFRNYIKEHEFLEQFTFGKIQSLKEDELREFIKGYFNGDGYLYVGQKKGRKQKKVELGFAIGNKSQRANEFQYMLWRLGINSIVKSEYMKRGTGLFYRVLITRKESLEKIIEWIDTSKYPEKFIRAKEALKEYNFKNYGGFVKDNWVKIRSITSVGKGNVIGFEVNPSHEIYSYLGMRTHNTGKTRNAAIKSIWFGFFAPLFASNIGEGICNVVVASITKDQAYLIFNKIRDFIHKSPTLRSKIVNETRTEMAIEWYNGSGITNFIVRPIGDTGDSLRGFTVNFAILDEAAYIPQVVYDAFIASTVTTKPHILLTSTPKARNGAFYNFCERSYVIYKKGIPEPILDEKGKPREKSKKYNWVQFHVTTFDNPYAASDPEVLDVIKSVSKAAERQELYGEFLDGGNSVISYNLMQEAIREIPRPKFEYFELGVDTSGKGSDETVLMTFGVTSDCIFPIDAYVEITTDQTQLAKKINELHAQYSYRRIYIDSTGLGDTLVDNCKAENPSLPIHDINFREFKIDLYKNLERLFEHRLINLSLLDPIYRDKLITQLSSMYFEYGKFKSESPEKVRTDSPHDDFADACALGTFGCQRGEEIQDLPDLFNDDYVDWD